MVYFTHTIPVEPNSQRWVKALSNVTGFGVPVFFALSAYLITELLTREKHATGSLNARSFYARRILRIWPLYFFMLSCGFVVSRLHRDWAFPVSGLIAYLVLVGNLYTARFGYLSSGIGPLWSISLEEQFYLVWPLVVRYATRRKMGIACCLCWVCSQCALMFLCRGHAAIEPTVWTNSLVQLQYFALGAGVSILLNGSIPKIRGIIRAAMIISALLVLFLVDLFLNPHRLDDLTSVTHTYPEFLLAGAAITVLLFGFLGFSSLEGWRTVRYFGKISYGLYVYHVPCLMILGRIIYHLLGRDSPFALLVIGLPVTISVASISYRYFETPFLRLKERFEVVRSRAI